MTVAVVICGDEPAIPHAIDNAVVVDGLCAEPGRMPASIRDVDSTVLVLHPGEFQLSHIQRALRSLDIDPFGAQIVGVEPKMDGKAVTASLQGLSARAAAYEGSEPEHAKPVSGRKYTRRAILRPPVPEYTAAPMITRDLCGAPDGCRACVDVCPQGAYSWQSGRIIFDKDVCRPCGRCVTGCPTAAISNPAVTPSMLAAQVGTLITQTTASTGIRFVCSRGDLSPQVGWFDVEVSCTSMVPGTWLLACIAMGAGSAALALCADSGCPLELDEHAVESIDFAGTLLASFGLDPDMIGTGRGSVSTPIAPVNVTDPFGGEGAVSVLLALTSATGKSPAVVHEGSPVGVVDIDPTVCTLCAQCAATCPTGALRDRYEDGRASVGFDAAMCANCRQCIAACPEFERGAIAVSPRVDVKLLISGRHTVNEGPVLMCERCGKPIAPGVMMGRIAELLGDDFEDTVGFLTRRCLDCRGQG